MFGDVPPVVLFLMNAYVHANKADPLARQPPLNSSELSANRIVKTASLKTNTVRPLKLASATSLSSTAVVLQVEVLSEGQASGAPAGSESETSGALLSQDLEKSDT